MINTIMNSIGSIIDFFVSLGNLFFTFVNLLPSPFNLIFQGYIVVALALLLWKVYKGG